VTVVRCPDCGAGSPESAQWCTLCFADLRPAPPPPPVRAVPAAAPSGSAPATAQPTITGPAAVALDDPLTGPLPGVVGASRVDPLAAVATWPCIRCGEPVPISLDACPSCGAGFLSGSVADLSLRIPGVGDVSRMSRGQRAGLAAALALGLMLVLVLLATLGGLVF
jgi:hypothetical protein